MARFARMLAVAMVAALALAACGGDDDDDGGVIDTSPTAAAPADGDASPAAGTTDGDAAAAGSVSVTGTDGLMFEPASLTAQSGEISVELTAESGVNHTFTVETPDGDVEVATADAGATDSGTIELEAGTYTFYCSVAGHREAGMEGTLVVE